MMLPGQGPRGPECGKTVFLKCDACGSPPFEAGASSCMGACCERCWGAWLVKEAREATERVTKGRTIKGGVLNHVVVSFDPTTPLDNATIRRFRRKAYRAAKRHGVRGALVITHPWRHATEDGTRAGYRVPGLHFHLIGLTDDGLIAPGRPNRPYVIKNIRALLSYTAVLRCVKYQLSHAGVEKGWQAVTWIGAFSRQALKVPVVKPPKRTCPSCGSTRLRKWARVDWSQIGLHGEVQYQRLHYYPAGGTAADPPEGPYLRT